MRQRESGGETGRQQDMSVKHRDPPSRGLSLRRTLPSPRGEGSCRLR
jgi:hypothetical protein